MDKKLKIELYLSSWRKLLACLESKDTKIDKYGDWGHVYVYDKETGRPQKDGAGNPIKVIDGKTGEPKTEKVDYDPAIALDRIVKEIKKWVANASI